MKRIFSLLGIIFIGVVVVVYISLNTTDKEFETCIIHNFEDSKNIDFKKHQTVLVSASSLYEGDVLKDIVQGENYRDAWTTPITAPIVFLDTLYGGMEIVKEGGGQQTHSLRLKSKKGVLYSLRSINKDPKKLIPEFTRTLGLQNIVVDGISAQHPYAAPVVARLADAVDVLHTHPMVVFVPEQKALGEFNEKYGNRLFMLEYETEGEKNWTHLSNVYKILDTEDLQELKMDFPQDVHIDKQALVRSRLLDMIIGDWDRHAKQWGWAVRKLEGKYTAAPIAGDRDNAFFNVDGLIPSILTNENVYEELRPFERDIDYMEGLVYDFDVYFLKDTPEHIFHNQAKYIQNALSDQEIERALRYWNDELYNLYAHEIAEKIKARREELVDFAKEFKRIIDSRPVLNVPLKGSEDNELNHGMIQCFECSE